METSWSSTYIKEASNEILSNMKVEDLSLPFPKSLRSWASNEWLRSYEQMITKCAWNFKIPFEACMMKLSWGEKVSILGSWNYRSTCYFGKFSIWLDFLPWWGLTWYMRTIWTWMRPLKPISIIKSLIKWTVDQQLTFRVSDCVLLMNSKP